MSDNDKELAQYASEYAAAHAAVEERKARRTALQAQLLELDNDLANVENSRAEALAKLRGGKSPA